MSKERPFVARQRDGLEDLAGPGSSDDMHGPVLTFRRMTPPPGSNIFSSSKSVSDLPVVCRRCREKAAQGGEYCLDCADIQNSLSKIAMEIKDPVRGASRDDLSRLPPSTTAVARSSSSDGHRSSPLMGSSLFSEMLEEIEQIQEPALPLARQPRDLPIAASPEVLVLDDVDPFDDLEDLDDLPPINAAGVLRHSPELPLARDLPANRPSPSQYIQKGLSEERPRSGRSPKDLLEPPRPLPVRRESTQPLSGTPQLSGLQAHDVDSLLLDLIQVGQTPPAPPKSPFRSLLIGVVGLLLLGAAAGAALFFFGS